MIMIRKYVKDLLLVVALLSFVADGLGLILDPGFKKTWYFILFSVVWVFSFGFWVVADYLHAILEEMKRNELD